MDIGGKDFTLEGRPGRRELVAIVRAVRKRWPAAIVSTEDDRAEIPYVRLHDFGTEFVIYRDADIAEEWDEKGYVESLEGTAVYIIFGDDALHITTDEALKDLVEEIFNLSYTESLDD